MGVKFHLGDLVTCSESHEIEQPMKVIGRNPWFVNSDDVYHVEGKHKRNGNVITITLTAGVLRLYNGEP